MKKLLGILVLSFIIFCFGGLTGFSNSEEGDCSTITPNTYEVVDTGFGLKYCFNAGKFLLLNKESKNKIFSYNLKNFKKNYLHSFGEISEEQLNKMDEDFAQFSPHVLHYNDTGSLLVHLIYNHFQSENIDSTLIFVKESAYNTEQVNKYMNDNIDKVCDDDSKYLSSRGYDILECNFINSTNNKFSGYKKIVGNYKNVQESIDLIQSRLEDFKIVNLVSRIIRYDIYYSYKNKNYFLNIISTCNEYKPKRSCDDENDQLRNLVNNLIFTTK